MDTSNPDWIKDCVHWRGRVLTGRHAHWCMDWDCLPIDETTPEWPCACADELIRSDPDRADLAECENQWACNASTLLWQRIHCKCLIEAERRDAK
jgi:hypothetical protein